MSADPPDFAAGPVDGGSTDRASSGRARLWLLSIVVWGVLITIMAILQRIGDPQAESLISRIGYLIYFIGPWILMTPALFELGERLPLFGGRMVRALVVHVSVLAAAIVIYPAIVWLMSSEIHRGFEDVSFVEGYVRYCALILPVTVLLYVLTTGIGTLFALAREVRARRMHEERMRGLLTEARLEALHAQLQPHFLFNTLHAIAGLVRLGDRDRAVLMITRLSNLLRRVLGTSRNLFIPLREEMKFLDDWLGIQQERLGERLVVDIRVPDDLLETPVPPLVLQPLVENAVRHGIAPRSEPGLLSVAVTRTDAHVLLTVENDGDPLTREIREGVGLTNTRDRLEGLYDDGARLLVELRPEGGVRARVELPLVGEPELPEAS